MLDRGRPERYLQRLIMVGLATGNPARKAPTSPSMDAPTGSARAPSFFSIEADGPTFPAAGRDVGCRLSFQGRVHAISIPTEPIGSIPRPPELQAAVRGFNEGRVSEGQLLSAQDAAVRDTIERFEATGPR